MSRQARLDAPGVLHHVMIRGIERRKIFINDRDQKDFLERLERLLPATETACYAWAFMANHAHLLIETPQANLSQAIKWINVSYATYFNRKRRRSGHLFQVETRVAS